MIEKELIIKEKEIKKQAEIEGITHFASGVAVINKGKVLLVRREINDFLGGNYEIPGGGIEDGETFIEGATRELKEETNLDVKEVITLFDGFDYSTSTKPKVRQINFLVTTYTYDVILSDEHDAFIWADKKDLNSVTMTEKMLKCTHDALNLAIEFQSRI